MKSKRFQWKYRESASSLHKRVGNCLRSGIFSGYQILQEYPVNMINTTFPSGREKFDWVIKDLQVVIEVHGQQHYRPSTFGGISQEEAKVRFVAQQKRDEAKKSAAITVGWTYICIPYTDEDKVSEEFILDLIGKYRNDQSTNIQKTVDSRWAIRYAEAKKRNEESGRAESQRAKAREYRKKQYRQQREEWKHRGDNDELQDK